MESDIRTMAQLRAARDSNRRKLSEVGNGLFSRWKGFIDRMSVYNLMLMAVDGVFTVLSRISLLKEIYTFLSHFLAGVFGDDDVSE